MKKYALGFPEAYEDHPWGESVAKVRKKIFVFLGSPDRGVSFTVKLPQTRYEALDMPFTKPTGYGFGKSGWVSVNFETGNPPVEIFKDWIEESYRAVAPKTLVKRLDPSATPKKKKKKTATRKKATKKKRRTRWARRFPTRGKLLPHLECRLAGVRRVISKCYSAFAVGTRIASWVFRQL